MHDDGEQRRGMGGMEVYKEKRGGGGKKFRGKRTRGTRTGEVE